MLVGFFNSRCSGNEPIFPSLSLEQGNKAGPNGVAEIGPHVAPRGGGVLPIMAYTGGSTQKGYLFQASVNGAETNGGIACILGILLMNSCDP